MPKPRNTRADDIADLNVLHTLETEGIPAAMQQHRATRGRIAGLRLRCLRAAEEIPCTCAKPENRDGAMGPRWWAE